MVLRCCEEYVEIKFLFLGNLRGKASESRDGWFSALLRNISQGTSEKWYY